MIVIVVEIIQTIGSNKIIIKADKNCGIPAMRIEEQILCFNNSMNSYELIEMFVSSIAVILNNCETH